MKKRYPLNQSPLYRLRRRKDLADLLRLSLPQLESLANATAPQYRCFGKVVGKKTRWIEWPRKPLQRAQKRLSRLLDRIEAPDYIHSGFRGRSYVTNAQQHKCVGNVAKIDIRSFFPQASSRWVRHCFADAFECSQDVAAILTKLFTIHGHLTTGGNSSTIVSFFAYKPMFDTIQILAKTRGVTEDTQEDEERAILYVIEHYGIHVRYETPQSDVSPTGRWFWRAPWFRVYSKFIIVSQTGGLDV